MYKVQNMSNGMVSFTLPKGGMMLTPGRYLDLDLYASREWLATSVEIQRLLVTHTLRLVHDSTVGVSGTPIRYAPTTSVKTVPVPISTPIPVATFPSVQAATRKKTYRKPVVVEEPVLTPTVPVFDFSDLPDSDTALSLGDQLQVEDPIERRLRELAGL